MIKTIGILLLWLFALSVPASASRSCHVPFIHTPNNQTVRGTMFVVAGKRCSISLRRSLGPIYNTHLVAGARNGRVSVNGYRVTYVSRPGYVGEDHFVYAREGLSTRNQPITRTVEVTVKVAERW
jgi:hypothetical protein